MIAERMPSGEWLVTLGDLECVLAHGDPNTGQPFENAEAVVAFLQARDLSWYFSPAKTPEQREAERLDARRARLLAIVEAEYQRRLLMDFPYDFGSAPAFDLDGGSREAGVLNLQMSAENQRDWQIMWLDAISSEPTDILTIICENRWYVSGPPSMFIAAFKAIKASRQQMLAGSKMIAKLIRDAENDAELDAAEALIALPVWGIS